MASLKPSPSSPRRFSAGTRALSKISSLVGLPCRPSRDSSRPTEKPGVSRGMTKAETPRWPASGSVLAKIT